ncbi:uncharacterized protein Z519_02418 [Cladophialophora bantiana CBS 173.52]|uniref:Uncharacterized protein n=1 Tax=Cladophialophora bantiana (strain ATCC 10958 / CBS 173.52 / CDC B-1940 / NIH 8579) TaxID=1442370 RepID=A0A0D2F4C1_CLAB1|nr:uncharacterized protein Z519_02418 [Cladophialophora bantiana CBS 173.52]KIW97026.1 hypothetical protein Z519_02418 [Cladophialophora bantiana CBS 173.52]
MNLLTRKTSSKSLSEKENRGRGPTGQDAGAAERIQEDTKPSLFRRLSRKTSRSREREGHGQNEAPIPQPIEARHERKAVAEDVGDKIPSSKVAEVMPELGHADTKKKHSTKLNTSPLAEKRETPHPMDPATEKKVASLPRSNSEGLQSHLESGAHDHPKSDRRSRGLTKEDVEHLFSGAPQFVLEKGRRGRCFPQAFFPWNNDLEISDLQDRRYIKHESFALATLHAHLPIPDEVNWKPGMAAPFKQQGLELGKRPMFELGIFERPNMLGIEGREPGTVGMRYFLERPVADGMTDEKIKEHGKDVEVDLALANAPAMEAFKMLALGKDNEELNAKIGKHAPAQERARLIREGPHAWKAVGVRDISMVVLAERMEKIGELRDHVLNAGWRVTVLNHMDAADLYAHLFNELLYPPHRVPSEAKHGKASLKIQIEALVKVLTTPGAWLDLSVPESRLRFGKILHSRTTRYDHETGLFIIDPERKWLLIQILLAVELVIRLDAALRLGVALHAENFEISSEEIHHFNKLRNLKVDWDLVAARRFLFLSYVKRIERGGSALVSPVQTLERPLTLRQKSSAERQQHHEQRPAHLKQKSSAERHSLFGELRHKIGLGGTDYEPHTVLDVCDVAIMSRQPAVMVDGLFRFATNIGWPRSHQLHESLKHKLCTASAEEREKMLMDAIVCPDNNTSATNPANLTPSLQSFNVDLHAATPTTVGGWLSHSWLSGMILPGTSICDILMSTLLENDPNPQTLRDLGSASLPLRGCGFILDGSSWWSKSCIVGRVMAPMRGAKESMGWIFTPNFVPLYENTGTPFSNRWVKVKCFPVITDRDRPRIFDGDRLAEDSTPLGKGKGGIMGTEFSMVTDHILDDGRAPEVTVKDIKVHLSSSDVTQTSSEHPLSAWAQFDIMLTTPPISPSHPSSADTSASETAQLQIRYGLDRAVYFVTSHPCRLPHGHATFKPGSADAHYEQQHPKHIRGVTEHIPAHPLHKTYPYVTKTLAEIVQNPGLTPPNPTKTGDDGVWVIDARSHGGDSAHSSQSNLCAAETPTTTPSTPSATATAGTITVTSPTASAQPDLFLQHYLHGSSDPQLWKKDILVRAWCAEKGRNAIVARVGRTCLSCAIREAKALEIAVIIRVGIKE